MGLDPLYMANEGRMVLFVPASDAAAVLSALKRANPLSRPCVIGDVLDKEDGRVTLETAFGGRRALLALSGEHTPRIC